MKKVFALLLLACLLTAGTAFAKPGVLLVAFGTTMDSAKPALDAIEQAYRKGDAPVVMAYTSDIIRKKPALEGKPVLSVNAAMNECAAQGITELTIQSLHIAPAEEFHQLERMIVKNLMRYPNRFASVKLGHPLLESEQDLDAVMDAVLAGLPAERKPGDAVVLMGHGNDRGPGDLTMSAVRDGFAKRDPLVFLATVEGAHSFDRVLPRLKAAGIRRVWLQPFMIVAGDHATNDLAGPEDDSWASRLRAEGMEPLPVLRGLGQLEGIQAVFLRHSRQTTDDLANSKKVD